MKTIHETAAARFDGSTRRASGSPPERVSVYLHAGQLFASDEPCEISTVLGSCVAVCLVDPIRRSGGANHYLLPVHVSRVDATPRFGNVAIAELVGRMVQLGSRKRDLRAKVFGGASLVHAEPRGVAATLGWKNVLVARATLHDEGIPIVAEDVGGSSGRRLVFLTDAGDAWVKRV